MNGIQILVKNKTKIEANLITIQKFKSFYLRNSNFKFSNNHSLTF